MSSFGNQNGFGLFTKFGSGWDLAAQPAYVVGNQSGGLYLHGTQGIQMQDAVKMTGHQITGMAKGTADTDAVNFGQLKSASASEAAALGGGSTVNADGTITKPRYKVGGKDAVGVDGAVTALDGRIDGVAGDVTNLGTQITNITNKGTKYFHTNSGLADSTATGIDSTAIGPAAKSVGQAAIAMGGYATTTGDYGTAIGNQSKAGDRGVAIGAASNAGVANAVALGASSVADRASGVGGSTLGAVSVGSGGAGVATGTRQIISVARGTQDTDAVNVSQLKGVTGALGGGSAVNADGTVKAPTYTIGGTTYKNVGDALSAAAASGADPLAVKYDDSSKGAVTLNKGGAAVTIGNVKAATVNDQAVNFGQLKSASTSEAAALGGGSAVNADGTITKPKYKVGGKDAVGVDGAVTALDGRIDGVAGDVTNLGTQITNITNTGTKYFHTNSGLADSTATGKDSTAIGPAAKSVGQAAIAMGGYATTTGDYGTAIGNQSTAGDRGVALGTSADASTGGFGVAIGAASKARVANAVALGASSVADRASGVGGSTMGAVSVGSGGAGVATGTRQIISVARGTQDTDAVNVSQLKGVAGALGGGSAVNADGTIKAPTYTVQGQTATDVGTALSKIDSATTKNTGDITTINTNINGLQKDSLQWDATAGTFSAKHGTSATNRIANVAAGTAATDAVNFGQLKSASTSEAAALGGGSTVNADGTITKPKYKVGGKDAVGVDGAVTALDGRIDGVAGDVTNLGTQITNITNTGTKYFHTNSGLADSTATGKDSTAIGPAAKSVGQAAIAMGGYATTTGDYGTAIGNQSTAGDRGVALGTSADASTGGFGVAIGAASKARVANAVALGASSVADRASGVGGSTMGAVSVGSGGAGVATGTRQIISVARGTQDTDAVNVSQLKGVAGALGGGSAVNADGTIKAPTYTVQGQTATDVGTALSKIDSATTKNTGDITTINTNINGLQKDSLQWDATAGTFSAKHGTSAMNRIANVAAGTAATDAVNFGQLKSASTSEAAALGGGSTVNADGTITKPKYKVGGKDAVGVDGAVTALDGRIDGVAGDVTNITNNINNGTTGLVQQASKGAKLTVGKGTDGSVVDFLGTAGARQLTNVAKGAVNATSVDAINGSQLYGTAQSAADAFGGGMTVDANGKVTKPKYSIGGTDYNNVGDALGAVQSTAAGTDAMAVKYDTAAKTQITLAGQDGTTLTNVAAGTADLDAVNVKQLKDAGVIDGNGNSVKAVLFNGPNGEANVAGKKIVNVAAGTAATDAVNFGQLTVASTSEAAALGGGSTVNADGTITKPKYKVGGKDAVGVDAAVTALDGRIDGVAGDVSTITNNINNGTTGLVQQASKGAKLTVGKDTDGSVVDFLGTAGARQLTNVAKGAVNATSVDAINGSQLYGTAQSTATALGGGSAVNADGTIKAPTYTVQGQTATDVGTALSKIDGATTKNTGDITTINTNINGLQKDSLQWDATAGSFSAKHGTSATNRIANVAAGTAATDAVNFGQLTAASTSEAAALGGGSTVNADGTITKPKYKVGGKDAVGVDGAVTALDGRIDGVAGDVTNITNNINNGTTGLVQQASKGAKLTVGKATDGSVVDFLGTAGARQLTNVAKGAVNAASVDAINGSQLYGTAQSAATALGGGSAVNADGTIKAPTYTVQGQTATDVGTALSKIDDATTKNTGDITTINTNINGLQKDSLQWDATAGTFSAKHGTSAMNKIANVAAGTAVTDAVNFGQLTAASQAEADALGGGSTVDANGKVTKPKYKLDGSKTTADNVGDAITNLDGRTTDNSSAITNITNNINNGTAGLVQQASKGEKLTVGKNTDGTEVNFTGTAGDRTLTGLLAGTVDNAAVNVSQLKGVADTIGGGAGIDPTTGKVINPTWIINKHTDGTGGTTVTNVGDAITSIDDRVTTVQGDVTNITNQINDGTIGMVQQAAAGEKLTVGKNTDGTEVNFTGTAGDRMLTGVAAGTVDNAAVNLGQLKGAVDGLGGGASIDPTTGAVTGPTYNVTNIDGTTTKVHNVGDAVTMIDGRVTNIDGRVTNVEGDITNIMNGTTGMVQQAAAGEKLTVGKDTNGKVVDFTGTAGERQLTGVAAGTVNASSVDAINGAQLFGVSQGVADAMGGGSTVNPDGTISAPSYTVAGTTVNNIGDAITNIDGRVTQNAGDISTINNTLNNITNGAGITYFHANSTLADSQALGMESVAIGGNAQSRASNSVALGSNSVADRANSVSVGSAGSERQITNVAAGTADTDAVNVAQLKASGIINPNGTTNTAVTYDKNPDGTTNYNSITMGGGVDGGTTIHNVAGGTAGNDAVNVNQMNQAISSVTNIAQAANNPMFSADGNRDTEVAIASGSHATAMGANANASAANAVALGANSVANRENTVSVGSAGNERQITNIAAGTATTDAVNVGQMNDSIGAAVGNLPGGMTAKDYTDQQVKTVQSGVNQVARGAYSGVAAATALSMIPDVDLGKTIAVGVGTANYKGYQATAIGASVRITQNLKAKLGAGISAAGTTVGVGASYQW